MTNEEFQKAVLCELKGLKGEFGELKEEIGGLKGEIRGLKEEVGGIKGEIGEVKGEIEGLKGEIGEIKIRVSNIETRQDEIYQVVRAIEHSNQVGKSELNSQNIRLAKVEGKIKKVVKVLADDVVKC